MAEKKACNYLNDIILSCPHGIEDYVVEEVAELGYKASLLKPSKVMVHNGSLRDIIVLNYSVYQIHRVYLLLLRFEVHSLKELREAAATIDFTHYMSVGQSFAVRGVREGTHSFTSVDIAREVGSAVTDCFQSKKNTRVHADLDNPDIEFMAELSENQFILTINTTGESLHRRDRRAYQHFAPLKASLAAALVRFSSFREMKNLLDPMAGGGTIPAEAYMMSAGIQPGIYVKRFAFEKFRFMDPEQLKIYQKSAIEKITDDPGIIIGAADKYHKNVEGMMVNLKKFNVTIYRGDARKLNYYPSGKYNLIVCNPPFGMRIGDKKNVKQLYSDFANVCAQKEIREIVGLTPEYVFWERSFSEHGYELMDKRRVLYGRLNCYMLKMTLT